ncbi:Poly-beta-hydroxybutyrate polymerase [Stieleria maiorica]|uniref:Poly(3-hydroxyalkanoate) polymerase subunit PhaC n=1 Tax=Stieleria maiorica TaxID=2795974 RepID=A0A5B9MI03_9BACT|nr:class III poly(R)-hydroxyalkanoic acid synthase subunit PhaC [Stieleria maiorica]QEG00759.1 Poly-beta-hydroxybutyrate polymerase [Stieleria maiorica]
MNDPVREPDASARIPPPLVRCWTDAVKQAAEKARAMQPAADSNGDPKRHRRRWFNRWGQATETYLRSPEFLQVLKQHIDTLIATKRDGHSNRSAADINNSSLPEDVRALAANFRRLLPQGTKTQRTAIAAESDRNVPPHPKGPPDKAPKWATSFDVVHEEPQMRLLHFSPSRIQYAQPVLVCFALVNRPYILDLKENRSVVRRLLDRGLDVYVIDWAAPGDADASLRLDDYIGSILDNTVNVVCEQSNASQLSLLGYCMGGTMTAMYTALHPERIKNLILMATPIDFDGHNGLLNLWARRETFDVDGLIDAFGNCPGEFLQFVFQLMKPVQNFAEKQLSYLENAGDAAFLDDFETIERWSNDTIPVAGETFRDFVSMLYQQNRLVNDQMVLAGESIHLASITCPILLLVAQRDHLVPPESTLAIQNHVASQDITTLSIPAGHIGLAVGSRAQQKLWPKATDWIANHSTER